MRFTSQPAFTQSTAHNLVESVATRFVESRLVFGELNAIGESFKGNARGQPGSRVTCESPSPRNRVFVAT